MVPIRYPRLAAGETQIRYPDGSPRHILRGLDSRPNTSTAHDFAIFRITDTARVDLRILSRFNYGLLPPSAASELTRRDATGSTIKLCRRTTRRRCDSCSGAKAAIAQRT